MNFDNYECDGQIDITDYLKSKIVSEKVMDLTEWINSQGEAQYTQIKNVVREACETYELPLNSEQIDLLTNSVSVYVLEKTIGYMEYLRKESEV